LAGVFAAVSPVKPAPPIPATIGSKSRGEGMSSFAPAPKSSPYITAAGYARLKAEYEELWQRRRPEVVRALSAAAAEGDRSENAEYQYRKKELREIDRRVRYLQLRLPILKVVERAPDDPGRVFFGAEVELEDADGQNRRYRIVGPDETGSEVGLISIDSPLARALLGKVQGDVFRVQLPGGEKELEILGVRYA
jgi:transcription elongation factor GreB